MKFASNILGIFVFLSFFLPGKYAFSQNDKTNRSESRDTAIIDSLIKIGDKFQYVKPDSAIYYYSLAEKKAKSCGCKDLLARIFNIKAIVLIDNSRLKDAYLLLDSAMKIVEDTNEYLRIKNNLAVIYSQLGFHKKAFEIYRQALEYSKKRNDSIALSAAYSNLSALYSEANIKDSVFYYGFLALELDKKIGDSVGLALDYYNLGAFYSQFSSFDSAKAYFDTALAYTKKLGLDFWLASIYLAFGELYDTLGFYDSAWIYYQKSIEFAKKQHNYGDLFSAYMNLSEFCLKANRMTCAKNYLDSLTRIYNKHSDNLTAFAKQNYLEVKYLYYKKAGLLDSALYYYEHYVAFKDSLDVRRQLNQLQIIKLELSAQKTQKELELLKFKAEQRKKLMIIFAVIVTVLFLLFAVMSFLVIRLRKVKEQLAQQNEELQRLLEKDRIQISLFKLQQIALKYVEKKPVKEFLTILLDELLNLDCLRIKKQGAIFLKDENGNLKLVAHKNLDFLVEHCKTVKPGQCLCGKAYAENQKIVCTEIVEQHTSRYDNQPHGHYIAPLGVGEEVIGVLNLYLYPGQKLSQQEEEFLNQVTVMLSLILERKLSREKLEIIAKRQDELNQRLFAQSLLLEEEKRKVERASEQIKQQAEKLKNTLQTLQDSITYASYMLESLLPSEKLLDSIFKEYFLIFKPIDKIGGDFYFASRVEDKIYLAIGDATGHGVPGAILAAQILGYLYEIIQQRKICEPKEILTSLREKVKLSYKQASHESIKNSGVDIGMCVIEPKTSTLGFAGANMPLYIVRGGELMKFKATKSPVGTYVREKQFEQHIIQLQDGDMIYLQSDGFIDQLSNNYKKFARRRYEHMLVQISDLPAEDQKDIIFQVFEQWKGNAPQTDDIVIFGFRWHREHYHRQLP